MKGQDPVVFDHDCREGICGHAAFILTAALMDPTMHITCQLHMRRFKNGDTITIEPWRSAAFPVIRDLMVDRQAFDKIIQAGGFISANTGGIPGRQCHSIPKENADASMDAAACIGCGACVAACKKCVGHVVEAAKVSHLSLLPQAKPKPAEGYRLWLQKWTSSALQCNNTGACEAECPADIHDILPA
ncbi:MAG: 2Fe-2S iron-sulfur cluster-binding protein [Bacteroidales bacterium]